MNELLYIIDVARRLRADGRSFAVATVVKIGGSTYRRPGARMIVDDASKTYGTISGGCLEAEIAEQAASVIESTHARLIPFKLGDDDVVLGFGTGCDGIVHVLIEPVHPASPEDVLSLLGGSFSKREPGILATVLDVTVLDVTVPDGTDLDATDLEMSGRQPTAHDAEGVEGTDLEDTSRAVSNQTALKAADHFFLSGGGDWSERGAPPDSIAATMKGLLSSIDEEKHETTWVSCVDEIAGERVELLLEIVRPPIKLAVFGDGHDVRAMANAAKVLGWSVVVVGRKPPDVLADRIPEADAIVFLMHPEEVLDRVQIDNRTAVVLMNHTYVRDRELLARLSESSARYIGCLGPAERTRRMLDELGVDIDQGPVSSPSRVYGPMGLDIGTETAEEIALATVAEIQSVMSGRSGTSLRTRHGPIHGSREST